MVVMGLRHHASRHQQSATDALIVDSGTLRKLSKAWLDYSEKNHRHPRTFDELVSGGFIGNDDLRSIRADELGLSGPAYHLRAPEKIDADRAAAGPGGRVYTIFMTRTVVYDGSLYLYGTADGAIAVASEAFDL